jgi:hypothetical protein
MDEHSPHAHAIVVPIDPNGKLNCKHYFGTREKLSQWQDRFADEVKDLGLERGVRDSRARHTDIKDFYKAIEREHRIKVNYEKLPDPPRMCVTKESAQKFKEEFSKALIKQIEKPIQTQLHQAMLARDSHNKHEETKKRLIETRQLLSKERITVMDLKEERERSEQRYYDAIQRTQKAEQRVQDVDHHSVMKMLGYRGMPGDKRGSINYINPQQTQVIIVRPGGVYDSNNQLIARNSVDLVREIMQREGKPSGRAEAVGWLADKCGQDRAVAASLVEHEQATEDHLQERHLERGRRTVTPTKDQTLTRPEPERVRDQGMEHEGHDRDSGFSR